MLQWLSAQLQSMESQIHQLRLGADTQRVCAERKVGQLQVELESERGNSETIKQQLMETEEHLKNAIADANTYKNREIILEKCAQKIALDAERLIGELQEKYNTGAEEQIQSHVDSSIANALFCSAHNEIMLRMREKLDQAEGKEGVELLHRMGTTNLELQNKVQSLRFKRNQAVAESTTLREENKTLSNKIACLEGELAE